MRYIISTCIIFVSFAIVPQLAAQNMQTLISGDVNHGGFGGPVVKFSSIDDNLGVWVGGRGGWILILSDHHSISLGGGGYGLVTNHALARNPLVPEEEEYAEIGYGGFEFEYTNRSYKLAHVTFTTLIGAGGLGLRDSDFNSSNLSANAFFVAEPGLHLELNMTHFFRIAAGVSYRFTSGISSFGYSDTDFSGVNGTLTFKFGSF